MWRTRYARDVAESDHGSVQRLAGWVEEIRNLGKIAFLVVRDRTGTFQVVLPKAKVPEAMFDELTKLNRESVVAVEGPIAPTKSTTFTWELKPDQHWVLSRAGAPLPLGVVDKVHVEIDTRLDARFMDLRRPGPQAIFKIRSTVLDAGRSFLRSKGFLEINTTKLIGSSSEGGTEVFKVQYFEKEAFLSQSPQLYKQSMMATGLDRVFEIATYFRAEKHNTPRHLNEITAFDLEMAFVENEEEVMQVIEGFFHHVWKRVVDEHSAELETVAREYHPGGFSGVAAPKLPFKRVPYDEALEICNARGMKLAWGDDPGVEGERLIGQAMKEQGHDFYFISRYPLSQKPFYCMPEDGTMDSKYARAFDLDYRGVELLSGAQRIHDPDLLLQGLARVGLAPDAFEGYLKAFRYGMPPHGGCGIGIERILMQMLELPNIREAVLFPRDRVRLAP
jgi:aspartyl-tRNA synthetase